LTVRRRRRSKAARTKAILGKLETRKGAHVMSTVTTKAGPEISSHPGRPKLDELVPSRYALRVGEIDVLVVSDGVLTLPGSMLGHNVDPAVRAA
jgi:hypothetical protein